MNINSFIKQVASYVMQCNAKYFERSQHDYEDIDYK